MQALFACRSPERQADLAFISIVMIVGICIYPQLAKPFCEGQPHSLPLSSRVMRSFPCQGSALRKAAWVLSRAPWVLADVGKLGIADAGLGIGLAIWLARLACALLLPDPLYTDVVAPLLTYAVRNCFCLFHIWLGPQHVPSPAAVFTNLSLLHIPLDICVSLTCQRPSMWLEAAHGVFNTACTILLCSWYSRNPATGVSFWSVLLKLSGYEPRQLGPGWEERLRAELEARGERLAGVYVRAGCIELMLETELPADRQGDAWSHPALASGTCTGLLAEEPGLLAAVVEALGLPPTAGPENAAQVLGSLRGSQAEDSPLQSGPSLSVTVRPRMWLLRPGDPTRLALELRVMGLPTKVAVTGWEAGSSSDTEGDDPDGSGRGAPAAPSVASGQGPLLEVLVRSRGRYLPVRVGAPPATGQRAEGSSGGRPAGGSGVAGSRLGPLCLRAEVDAAGAGPGLTQVDLRLGGRPLCALPLLLLPAGREDLAAELGRLAEATRPVPGAAGAEGSLQGDVLGGLMYDLGSLLYGDIDDLHVDVVGALAAHLLEYAETAGLPATAAAIREAVEARTSVARGGKAAARSSTAKTGGGPSCSSCWAAAMEHLPSTPAGPRPWASSSTRATAWRDVGRALLLSLGLVREGPAQAEAFRAAADGWAAAQAHIIQAVELLSLLSSLVRGRGRLSPARMLVWFVRCGPSLVTAAAWPLLPPHAWRRLAGAVRRPRYAAMLGAKAAAVAARLPTPASMVPYYSGLSMVALEGAIMPATCPLSLAASVVLSALRLPLHAALIGSVLAAGAGQGPGGWPLTSRVLTGRALLLAARVEMVALATTLACNVYLRLGCRRGRERRAKGQPVRGSGHVKAE
ncbi:hypothetical protein GPECTOR_8g335 [Gonium pectorale]|uniref:Uncharacterized protein n=1 Tax=Gonium pectorale TaxID=33097 RepID=A0A150GTB7_GONPE|nr:hypothetical protein GPECTOR_8g335 [Gonium pectorale]|eukprot:KXZ52962.1 hypothetical protein GPECTOR_8g335 [Gonium pectorale]